MGERQSDGLKLIGLFVLSLAVSTTLIIGRARCATLSSPMAKSSPVASPAASPSPAAAATPAAQEASKTPQYVSGELCKACHYKETQEFTKTMMGHLFMLHPRDDLEQLGCQGCHGPGSLHVKSGGKDVGGMITFNPKLDPSVKADNAKCLACHSGGQQAFWRAGTHAFRGLACGDCHTVMRDVSPRFNLASARQVNPFIMIRPQTQVCLRCHMRKRMQMELPSRMPLWEGLMVCTDCHNPHGGPYPHMLCDATVNEVCYRCHAEKRGPFLWTHPPVMMNCDDCHTPHGSINRFMLKIREPRLCQQCHIGTFHPGTPAGIGSVLVFNRACTNCHSQVHGSNSPGGQALTR